MIREVELYNHTKQTISYWVNIDGCADFSISENEDEHSVFL